MEKKSIFQTLNDINVNGHTEVKDTGRVRLTYLSWAWAWAEVKKNYPDATYTVYENANGWNYHTDGRTCWVKTGVTIEGMEHIEYLPVMDNRNNSIPADKVTSMDVNKAIQRSLTKAAARHGLGLYIYAGEDLPETESVQEAERIEREELEKAKKEISMAQSRDELTVVWNKYSSLKTNQEFINAVTERSKMIAA